MSQQDLDYALRNYVYPDQQGWYRFLRLLFVALGVGFAVAGIVFFFAYNWDDLHKFAKFALVLGLIAATTLLALHPRISLVVRHVLLTGSAVLVGVLFAVFGQVYQTGANAYDFFLAWTIFITLWVLVANFAPLWLLYIGLIHTALILYSQQVASGWSEVLICLLLFMLDASLLLLSILYKRWEKPKWFQQILALAAAGFPTTGIVIGIVDEVSIEFFVLLCLTAVGYALAVRYGMRTKSIFYPALVAFSLIIITSAFLLDMLEADVMYLLVAGYIVAAVTLTTVKLVDIQRKWAHEQ